MTIAISVAVVFYLTLQGQQESKQKQEEVMAEIFSHLTNGNGELAEPLAREYIKKNTDDPNGFIALFTALALKDEVNGINFNVQEAEEIYSNVEKLSPNNLKFILAMARLYADKGMCNKSSELFLKVYFQNKEVIHYLNQDDGLQPFLSCLREEGDDATAYQIEKGVE
ncbi:MAG: hypothetical protein ACI9LK_003125 [Chromatiales bacterium]